MTPEQRRSVVLQQEGASLQLAGSNVEGREFLRLQIDGVFNALIRIEGAEAASAYAFALADRVCAGLREPTDFRAPAAARAAPQKAAYDALYWPWTFGGGG